MTDTARMPASAPTPPPAPEAPHPASHEMRFGDRGEASGRNIAQNRAIGHQDPLEAGSRQGGEQGKKPGPVGTPERGTDAAQIEEARQVEREKSRGKG